MSSFHGILNSFDKHEDPNDPIFGMLMDCHDHTKILSFQQKFSVH